MTERTARSPNAEKLKTEIESKVVNDKDESFISVVTVLDRTTCDCIGKLKSIQGELSLHSSDYEIVLVVQKSMRLSYRDQLEKLLQELPSIRYLQLSSDVSGEVAWSAGLENAIGDFVVCFNLKCDPTGIIYQAVDLCKTGHDVVVGTVNEQASFGYRLIRPFAGWLLKLIDYRLPKGATSFRCLSRRAVNAVLDTGRFYQQLFMQIQRTGYGWAELPYKEEVTGPAHTLAGGILSAMRLMVFNTTLPLRMMSLLGLLGSSLALLFSLYSVLLKFFKDDVVVGWASTILVISLFSTMMFIILAFISEYLNRILTELSKAGEYSVVFEKQSSVMIDLDRINVLDNSENNAVNLVQTGRDR